jgi:hypothetical protein
LISEHLALIGAKRAKANAVQCFWSRRLNFGPAAHHDAALTRDAVRNRAPTIAHIERRPTPSFGRNVDQLKDAIFIAASLFARR